MTSQMREIDSVEDVKKIQYNQGGNCNRLTSQFAINLEACGRMPQSFQNAFTGLVKNDVQPYIRWMTVRHEWMPLSLGWFNEDLGAVGQIILENATGRNQEVNPTPEQLEAMKDRILWISFDQTDIDITRVGGLYVPPGDFSKFYFDAVAGRTIFLKAGTVEPVSINVIIMPR